jgi:hypothetical protein
MYVPRGTSNCKKNFYFLLKQRNKAKTYDAISIWNQ